MTNEHFNTQLYWKLQRGHKAFKNWLMDLYENSHLAEVIEHTKTIQESKTGVESVLRSTHRTAQLQRVVPTVRLRCTQTPATRSGRFIRPRRRRLKET